MENTFFIRNETSLMVIPDKLISSMNNDRDFPGESVKRLLAVIETKQVQMYDQ